MLKLSKPALMDIPSVRPNWHCWGCSGALAAWRARMRSLHTYPTLATALATFARAARSAIAQQVPACCSTSGLKLRLHIERTRHTVCKSVWPQCHQC